MCNGQTIMSHVTQMKSMSDWVRNAHSLGCHLKGETGGVASWSPAWGTFWAGCNSVGEGWLHMCKARGLIPCIAPFCQSRQMDK